MRRLTRHLIPQKNKGRAHSKHGHTAQGQAGASDTAHLPITAAHPACVILPVYRDVEMTRRCILAALPDILASPNAHLVAINDASPDAGMQAMLEELAVQWPDKLVVLSNQKNLGFVGTVNRGLAHFPLHDAVLLNSDVIVPEGWLGRLISEAYSQSDIGTVTPLSNNATICSFPISLRENARPFNLDVNVMDQVFKETYLPCVEAPTGVGFCMYVRRSCLDETGPLNQDKFGRGYGEENDLCQRALKRGWRNMLSPNLYVYHQGGVSFSSEKKALIENSGRILDGLHPNYHADIQAFLAKDPLKSARLLRHIQLLARAQVPKILHVSHALGGGVSQHIEELARNYADKAAHILLRPCGGSGNGVISISLGIDVLADRLIFLVPKDYIALVNLLKYIGISAVHTHHVAGLRPKLFDLPRDLGVTHLISIHDYNLLNDNAAPSQAGRETHKPWTNSYASTHPFVRGPKLADTGDLGRRFDRLIMAADCVIFPSNATKRHFEGVGILGQSSCVVAPHIEAFRNIKRPPSPFFKKPLYEIGALGAIGKEKGADLLERVAKQSGRLGLALNFRLIGYAYRSLEAVKTSGPYRSEDLPRLICDHGLDVIFFPTQCPETYSYTLSQALSSGLPIIAPDIGAFPERLSGRTNTFLYKYSTAPDELVCQISDFLRALEAGIEIRAPAFRGDESRAGFYDCDYLALASRCLKRVDLGAFAIPDLDRFLVPSMPDCQPSTWHDRFIVQLWRLYMRPTMRWVNYVVPYSARRFIKRSFSRAPMHDLVNGKT